jgi:hypothetical protein
MRMSRTTKRGLPVLTPSPRTSSFAQTVEHKLGKVQLLEVEHAGLPVKLYDILGDLLVKLVKTWEGSKRV